jgi:hypothetical protein
MKNFLAVAALLLVLCLETAAAFACDQDKICDHIRWCLTDPTIDPNDVKNLNWSIDVGSGFNVRYNTRLCQHSRSPSPGDWDNDEQACPSDETMIGMARLARANNCRPKPAPAPPQPTPRPDPGNTMNWCELPSGIACPTTAPIDSTCDCHGEFGRSRK